MTETIVDEDLQRQGLAPIARECIGVVYEPRRRKRSRFPENCVQEFDSESEARAAADQGPDSHAARLLGPSRSSEGFRLYYLIHWL